MKLPVVDTKGNLPRAGSAPPESIALPKIEIVIIGNNRGDGESEYADLLSLAELLKR